MGMRGKSSSNKGRKSLSGPSKRGHDRRHGGLSRCMYVSIDGRYDLGTVIKLGKVHLKLGLGQTDGGETKL